MAENDIVTTNESGEQNNLPSHVIELKSDNGKDRVLVSSLGGQVWDIMINGKNILFALSRSHSITTDKRPIEPNEYIIGETRPPGGGSFLSFGGGEIKDAEGRIVKKAPVHGPYSKPWYKFVVDKLASNFLSMIGKPGKNTKDFFLDGNEFSVKRSIDIVSNVEGLDSAVVIETSIKNESHSTVTAPEMIEHSYLVSGAGASIIDHRGRIIPVDDLHKATTAKNNDIDTRIEGTQIVKAGECAFLPNGKNGHVVVITATMQIGKQKPVPIETFCVYRHKMEEGYTALEPVTPPVELMDGESVTMRVSYKTFNSLEEYIQSQISPE